MRANNRTAITSALSPPHRFVNVSSCPERTLAADVNRHERARSRVSRPPLLSVMLAIALGIGAVVVLWAIYKVIVYALPCLLGLGAGGMAFSTGAGWIGAIIAGSAAAVASFVFVRYLLTRLRSKALRWSVGLLLILPTAALAYSIGLGALAANVPTEIWRQALAIAFAAAMSAIAFVRLTNLDTTEE